MCITHQPDLLSVLPNRRGLHLELIGISENNANNKVIPNTSDKSPKVNQNWACKMSKERTEYCCDNSPLLYKVSSVRVVN
jgi:hypothetical protein